MEMSDITPDLKNVDAGQASKVADPTATTGAGVGVKLPPDVVAVLPLRNSLLFPTVVMPFTVGRERSVAAIQHAVRTQSPIAALLQRDPETLDPTASDLHEIGTVGLVIRYVTAQDGSHHLICRGDQRFRVVEFLDGYPFLAARIARIEEPEESGPEIEARFLQLRERAVEALKLIPNAPDGGARRSHHQLSRSQDRGEAADPRDLRSEGAARPGTVVPRLPARGAAPLPRHRRAHAGQHGEPPARAPAA
jgi:Lon protease-like protein